MWLSFLSAQDLNRVVNVEQASLICACESTMKLAVRWIKMEQEPDPNPCGSVGSTADLRHKEQKAGGRETPITLTAYYAPQDLLQVFLKCQTDD
ncbi:hypothetical protein AAFF_G00205970 [Aldrovandia affinis]|uniref:Uncharacterized protein n=1 Tax=Aldrovandia affinis TaxID=143900 RepID=A0AAD7W685_9TELE|nr:hypothetical protein AAFF_G00205970 [Aldrovandia affinis]